MTVLQTSLPQKNYWQPQQINIDDIVAHNAIFAPRTPYHSASGSVLICEPNTGNTSVSDPILWLTFETPEGHIALGAPAAAFPQDADPLDIELSFEPWLQEIEDLTALPLELVSVELAAPQTSTFFRTFSIAIEGVEWPVTFAFHNATRPVLAKLFTPLRPEETATPEIYLPAAIRIGTMQCSADDLTRMVEGAVVLPQAADLSNGEGILLIAGRDIGPASLAHSKATLKEFTKMPEDISSPPTLATDRLADVPLKLEFVAGTTQLRLAELNAMGPGSIIELDPSIEAGTVNIVINGHVFGIGELVTIGGRLGIEVKSFAQRGLPSESFQNG